MNSTKLGCYRWHAVANQSELRYAALRAILDNSSMAVQQRGQFHLVLSGGDTPREIYQQLRSIQTDWSTWHIYFSDERCLLPNDSKLNSCMAREVWLDHVPIPESQMYIIPVELGASRAACKYAQTLRSIGMFDLTFLGLGEDGHTASLFPEHEWGIAPDSPDTLAVFDAPKPPLQRVSMSAARLSRSRQVMFLVKGESKHIAVSKWRKGKNIPARAIMPITGVDVLLESSLLVPLSA